MRKQQQEAGEMNYNYNKMRSVGSRFFQNQRGSGNNPRLRDLSAQYQYGRGGGGGGGVGSGGNLLRPQSRPITYDPTSDESSSFQSCYSSPSNWEEPPTTPFLGGGLGSRSRSDRQILQMNLMMDEREYNLHNLNAVNSSGNGNHSRIGTAQGNRTGTGTPGPSNNGPRITKTGQRNLIVNYLPQKFTDKDLFDLFIVYGPIQSVKIMKEFKSGYSYGFGFVNFHRDEDALNAIEALNGIQVENKRLKVSIARPPSDDIKDTNVYITNLPLHYDEHDLRLLFGPFGDIVQNHILRDKETNTSRGAAFVRFDLREQASRAIITMNGCIPEGGTQPLRVKLAQDHGKQKAAYLAGFKDAWFRRRATQLPRNLQLDMLNTRY